jgi:hypothetical protein
MKQKIIIYDLEASSTDVQKAVPVLMGFKSSEVEGFKYTTNIDEMVALLHAHDVIVGYNSIDYDNEIMKRYGARLKSKINIDLMQILHGKGFGNDLGRKTIVTTPDGKHLGSILHSKKLADATLALGGPHKIGDFDYNLFKKRFDELTSEQQKEALEYLKADIEATEYIYKYLEEFFKFVRDGGETIRGEYRRFMTDEQRRKKQYLTASTASVVYKIICNLAGIEERYGNAEPEAYGGGFVADPSQEVCEGNIYCLDYNCFPSGTQIRMWRDSHQYYDKSIDDLKVGDYIVNHEGKQEIGAINKQKYVGDLIDIELENGLVVSCTPDHKFPLKNGQIKEAKDLTEDDELLTTFSKKGQKNPNYKGKILKICEVCGSEFEVFKSQKHIKSCSKDCANILRSVNSAKPNLGKTWTSKLKGVPRTDEVKQKISMTTKEAMKNIDMKQINKKRDMSFLSDINWYNKVRLSRLKSVKNGKFAYKGINFRSNWERMLAQVMDKKGIIWQYEPKVIPLSNGKFYTPDFYLPEHDKWVEVKGYMYDHSRQKIQQFIKEGNDLILLDDLNKITDEGVKWLK